ncbi:hypothetical protein GWI33_020698 [Rhynchophorus ferrugineus]|uniref:Lipase domain-containing protein n=1 Tax=Rhynchophorus ferrugineus TaxID=354439 RepID=A0A834HW24_RHYFE|nr:hypothetical protein GWI33_020698 [Rhynchophorus ferrugineus]
MSASVGAAVGLSMLTIGALYATIQYVSNEVNKNAEAESNNITKSYLLAGPGVPEVQYVLFTRGNVPYNIEHDNLEAMVAAGYNVARPTKIVTHGFLSGIKFEVFTLIKDAYLNTSDYNVIGLDWSALCQSEYISATRGARRAGEDLGDFLNWLVLNGVAVDSIHLIGHSLGAHVMALGASKVRYGQVGRITGLDPAGPGYGDVQDMLRLDPHDAKLVDVIHTYLVVIGETRPLGHVDFYPNGGRYQPGCPNLIGWQPTETIFCNHGRSYILFAESIWNPKAFKSNKCESLNDALNSRCLEETDVFMGQPETYRYGLYYFKTRSQYPYSWN